MAGSSSRLLAGRGGGPGHFGASEEHRCLKLHHFARFGSTRRSQAI
jgi:hypothetical protein